MVERSFWSSAPMGSSSSSSFWDAWPGSGQGHPLALTTGELVRLAAGVLGHLHQFEHLFHPGVDLRLGRPSCLRPKAMFWATVNGEQGGDWKHHVDGAFRAACR